MKPFDADLSLAAVTLAAEAGQATPRQMRLLAHWCQEPVKASILRYGARWRYEMEAGKKPQWCPWAPMDAAMVVSATPPDEIPRAQFVDILQDTPWYAPELWGSGGYLRWAERVVLAAATDSDPMCMSIRRIIEKWSRTSDMPKEVLVLPSDAQKRLIAAIQPDRRLPFMAMPGGGFPPYKWTTVDIPGQGVE